MKLLSCVKWIKPNSEYEEKYSLKVHEWLAITITAGIIGGLACLTSFNQKKESSKIGSSFISKHNIGFEVLVKGAVEHPGIYHLHSEIQLKDLLAIAGVSSDADLRKFSLSGVLKKGRVINIPSKPMINIHLKGAVEKEYTLTVPKNTKLEDLIGIAKLNSNAEVNFLKKKRRLKPDEVIYVPEMHN